MSRKTRANILCSIVHAQIKMLIRVFCLQMIGRTCSFIQHQVAFLKSSLLERYTVYANMSLALSSLLYDQNHTDTLSCCFPDRKRQFAPSIHPFHIQLRMFSLCDLERQNMKRGNRLNVFVIDRLRESCIRHSNSKLSSLNWHISSNHQS